jgi:hypothetical protein
MFVAVFTKLRRLTFTLMQLCLSTTSQRFYIKINFNIILPSTPRPLEVIHSLRFNHEGLVNNNTYFNFIVVFEKMRLNNLRINVI